MVNINADLCAIMKLPRKALKHGYSMTLHEFSSVDEPKHSAIINFQKFSKDFANIQRIGLGRSSASILRRSK